MPFKSEKQRRFMFAKHPRIAKRWAEEEKKAAGHKTKRQRAVLKKFYASRKRA